MMVLLSSFGFCFFSGLFTGAFSLCKKEPRRCMSGTVPNLGWVVVHPAWWSRDSTCACWVLFLLKKPQNSGVSSFAGFRGVMFSFCKMALAWAKLRSLQLVLLLSSVAHCTNSSLMSRVGQLRWMSCFCFAFAFNLGCEFVSLWVGELVFSILSTSWKSTCWQTGSNTVAFARLPLFCFYFGFFCLC